MKMGHNCDKKVIPAFSENLLVLFLPRFCKFERFLMPQKKFHFKCSKKINIDLPVFMRELLGGA